MISVLTGFVSELRQVGIPVSMVEAIDAAAAVEHIPLADRTALRHGLAACLVKNAHHLEAFDAAFDVFFAHQPPLDEVTAEAPSEVGDGGGAGTGTGEADVEQIIAGLVGALSAPDYEALQALARQVVGSLAGIQPGRPVGGRYYLYRVLSRLGADALPARLMANHPGVEGLERTLLADEYRARLNRFEAMIEDEIRRRLVADRGREAVAKTTRRQLLEDVDLAHAPRAEIARMERIIQPLARKLAARLAHRRRHLRKGRLDIRRTVRHSLSTGGLLADPQFKAPRIAKPDIVLLCDISGSVATFAHFTMQFMYALSAQFSRVRAFAFVDGVDEVTGYFAPGVDFHDAIGRISREARVVDFDGHSDYGNVLERFAERYPDAITPRTTVIVTGDGRNNYRPARGEVLAHMAREARAVYWLNPEPVRFWDTGDSVMREYVPSCDGAFEVRTLRQLEVFVEELAMAAATHSTAVKV
ncbi:MAG: VWA domain-containing protein [Acidimicrobiia bacterium]|nr:MAG: VWA domain-containing protein [Acidimicrobiia bacterium]